MGIREVQTTRRGKRIVHGSVSAMGNSVAPESTHSSVCSIGALPRGSSPSWASTGSWSPDVSVGYHRLGAGAAPFLLAMPMLGLLVLPVLALIPATTPADLVAGLRHPLVRHRGLWLSARTTVVALGVVLAVGRPLAGWLVRGKIVHDPHGDAAVVTRAANQPAARRQFLRAPRRSAEVVGLARPLAKLDYGGHGYADSADEPPMHGRRSVWVPVEQVLVASGARAVVADAERPGDGDQGNRGNSPLYADGYIQAVEMDQSPDVEPRPGTRHRSSRSRW